MQSDHRSQNRPRRISIASLALAALLLPLLASAPAPAATMPLLDWSMLSWSNGQLSATYPNVMLSDGSFVDILVSITFNTVKGNPPVWDQLSANNAGCSTVMVPNLDGAGYSTDRFGSLTDLAVVYDPAPNESMSAVDIVIEFFQPGTSTPRPLSLFEFEISDIDHSGPGDDCTNVTNPMTGALEKEGFRLDRVTITSDNGSPTLFFKTPGTQTFSISGNVATALLNRASGPGADNGTTIVRFGAMQPVSFVMATYTEAAYGGVCASAEPWCVGGQNVNPGFRGIAIFGSTSVPVELQSFAVE